MNKFSKQSHYHSSFLLSLGNISAVKFTVEAVDQSTVIVNITDPLTSIHQGGKQLSIRDVLKNDLKYKISYYKSGSTGKVLDEAESHKHSSSFIISGRPHVYKSQENVPSVMLRDHVEFIEFICVYLYKYI